MAHKIKILQWNARSIKSNKSSFEYFISEFRPDICLISETWLTDQDDFHLKNYSVVRHDRVDKIGGGSAILIHKKINNFFQIQFYNIPLGLDICGIVTTLNGSNFSVISLYNPPNLFFSKESWYGILQNLQGNFIIGGDFNAHHQCWGDSYTNNMGRYIMEIANDNQLFLLNDGSPTCFKFNPPSVTDLTFSSANLSLNCTWEVTDEFIGSDHLAIIINVGNNLNSDSLEKVIYPSYKWNVNNVDWESYSSKIDRDLPNFDLSYEGFIEILNASADINIPLKKPFKIKNKYPCWWNKECFALKKMRKACFKKYKLDMSFDNFREMKQVENFVKQRFKEIKLESFKSFCESLNPNSSSKDVWEKVKIMKNSKTSLGLNQNLSTCLWSEKFLNKLTPMTVDFPLPDINFNSNNGSFEFFAAPFNFRELEISMKFSKNNAPGQDQILYPMLSNLSIFSKTKLLSILNNIWQNNIEISDFKTIVIKPILKPGKNPDDPNSYRPISLLSTVYKTLERLIKFRLEHWLENKKLLPATQFGFRKSRSAIDAVNYLVADVELSLAANQYTLASFIDISAAYDNVNLNILYDKLLAINIPHFFAFRLVNLFKNRQIFVKIKGELIGPRICNLGLPQGSVLSPLLFNIYCLDLYDYVGSKSKIIQFADDFCFYISAQKLENCKFFLSNFMFNFDLWCLKNGFSVSAEKSAAVIFSRHRHKLSTISLGPFQFSVSKFVKYLGIYIDQKLSWAVHIENVIKKCQKSMNILKSLTSTWWGGHPSTLLVIYKAIIRSHLDFGCLNYSNISKKLFNSLNRIQNQALRICLGAMKSSPIPCLLSEASEPPLSLRFKYIAEKYILRMFRQKNEPFITKIHKIALQNLTNATYWSKKSTPLLAEAYCNLSYTRTICDSFSLFDFPFDSILIKPLILPILNYSSDVSAAYNQNLISEILEKYKFSRTIFTDGSKTKLGVGAAFFDPYLKHKELLRLDPSCSIFTAESIAILSALNYVEKYKISKVVICSDSLSILTMLQNFNFKSKISNFYIFKILNKLWVIRKTNPNNKIAFLWVKSHNGIKYNEIVDKLAKTAVNSTSSIVDFKVPFSDLIMCIKNSLNVSWINNFSTTTSSVGQNYSIIHGPPKRVTWFHNTNRPRKFITTIIRMKLGHCNIPSHLNRLKIVASPICSFCADNEIANLNHILFGCSGNFENISILKKKLVDLGFPFPINFNFLFSNLSIEVIDAIVHFLDKSKFEV